MGKEARVYDLSTLKFTIADGSSKKIDDVPGYIKRYLKEHPDTQVVIGCDSANKGAKTIYVVCIALRIPTSGAHLLKTVVRLPRNPVISDKLLLETTMSVHVASELMMNHEITISEIHLDYNPNPNEKSHTMYEMGMGWVSSMGIKAVGKPDAWAATSAADKFCK